MFYHIPIVPCVFTTLSTSDARNLKSGGVWCILFWTHFTNAHFAFHFALENIEMGISSNTATNQGTLLEVLLDERRRTGTIWSRWDFELSQSEDLEIVLFFNFLRFSCAFSGYVLIAHGLLQCLIVTRRSIECDIPRKRVLLVLCIFSTYSMLRIYTRVG